MRPSPSRPAATPARWPLATLALALLASGAGIGASRATASEAPGPLIDFASSASGSRIVPSSPEVTFERRAVLPGGQLDVTIKPGADAYPGITVKPKGEAWDLGGCAYVEARVVNTGDKLISTCLRVDNDGDWQKNPYNSEIIYLEPGAVGTVTVRFGSSWGKPGYPLDPTKITKVMLFTGKAEVSEAFRLESLRSGGTAGESPKPKDGIMVGPGRVIDATRQLEPRGNAKAELVASAICVSLPKSAEESGVLVKPATPIWDLRDHIEVTVRARNTGKTPVTLRARIECGKQSGEWVAAATPTAPGAEQRIVLPFAGTSVWTGEPGTGSHVVSDAVTGIAILASAADAGREITVDLIKAGSPVPHLPEWLGKRPPVEGAWKQTLDENFDGTAIDDKRWTVIGDNFWDKQSHFSAANTIVRDGLAKLRFEKKRGHVSDDPSKPETDYTTGFLTSFGKWTQRYGYLEARMKLPSAPGLWPAFWTMPDRGAADGIWWKRQRTVDGGMEHDIMEYLTRYGPNRYNIALHWDGYEKDHKMVGTDANYVLPDKDGYIVSGMLWEPGKLTFFGNGAVLATWSSARVSDVPAYIMFTNVCGGWGGNDLTGEHLPDDFVVDWVRAWQRDDLAALPAKPLTPDDKAWAIGK